MTLQCIGKATSSSKCWNVTEATSGDNVNAANRLLPVANLTPTHSPLQSQLVLFSLIHIPQRILNPSPRLISTLSFLAIWPHSFSFGIPTCTFFSFLTVWNPGRIQILIQGLFLFKLDTFATLTHPHLETCTLLYSTRSTWHHNSLVAHGHIWFLCFSNRTFSTKINSQC